MPMPLPDPCDLATPADEGQQRQFSIAGESFRQQCRRAVRTFGHPCRPRCRRAPRNPSSCDARTPLRRCASSCSRCQPSRVTCGNSQALCQVGRDAWPSARSRPSRRAAVRRGCGARSPTPPRPRGRRRASARRSRRLDRRAANRAAVPGGICHAPATACPCARSPSRASTDWTPPSASRVPTRRCTGSSNWPEARGRSASASEASAMAGTRIRFRRPPPGRAGGPAAGSNPQLAMVQPGRGSAATLPRGPTDRGPFAPGAAAGGKAGGTGPVIVAIPRRHRCEQAGCPAPHR